MKKRIEIGTNINPHHDHKDWLYQDILPLKDIDIVCDAKSLPMIPDNYMEEVYASHVIEHFYFSDVANVLREWLRILKPGGVLTLILPDFMKLWEILIKKEKPKYLPHPPDTFEDIVARLMVNDTQPPGAHRNHYPYYWYKNILEKFGCKVELKREYTWHVPEVKIWATKMSPVES